MPSRTLTLPSKAVEFYSNKTLDDLVYYTIKRFQAVPAGPMLFADFTVEQRAKIIYQVLADLGSPLFYEQNIEIVPVQISLASSTERIPQHILQSLFTELQNTPYWDNAPMDIKSEWQQAHKDGIGHFTVETKNVKHKIEENRETRERQQAVLSDLSLGANLFGIGFTIKLPFKRENYENSTVIFTEKTITESEKIDAPDDIDILNNLNYLISRASDIYVMFYTSLIETLKQRSEYDPSLIRAMNLANRINNHFLVQLAKWVFFPIYWSLLLLKWFITPFVWGIMLVFSLIEYVVKLIGRKSKVVKEPRFFIILDGLDGDELLQNNRALSQIRSLLSNPQAMFLVFADNNICKKL